MSNQPVGFEISGRVVLGRRSGGDCFSRLANAWHCCDTVPQNLYRSLHRHHRQRSRRLSLEVLHLDARLLLLLK
jgi:hypothetical protein